MDCSQLFQYGIFVLTHIVIFMTILKYFAKSSNKGYKHIYILICVKLFNVVCVTLPLRVSSLLG